MPALPVWWYGSSTHCDVQPGRFCRAVPYSKRQAVSYPKRHLDPSGCKQGCSRWGLISYDRVRGVVEPVLHTELVEKGVL